MPFHLAKHQLVSKNVSIPICESKLFDFMLHSLITPHPMRDKIRVKTFYLT